MTNYHKYLHIRDIDRDLGFYVTTVGYSKIDKYTHYPDVDQHPADHVFSWNNGRILDGYYIVFITAGRGVFESANTSPQVMEPGMCFLLFPGIWHRYKPDPAFGWEEYWVGFNGNYPQHIMSRLFNPESPFIKTGLSKDVMGALTQLLGAVSQAQIGYQQVISGTTLQIIGLLNRINLTEKTDSDPETIWVSKAIFKFQNELANPINMEDLVAEFPISYSKFRKSFKRLTGKSPNQYHLDLRLDKAQELLRTTRLSITEVGYQTGFDSPFYFSRLFKKKFGLSPKNLRG
ncbi:helix-turn-helix transcriptional regulator [Sphingobacterium sp. SYP-B4668]|uniref:helix-turn-helix transcriptional regulator n=1 Tax=Sphingobacterium sp. SYP-B4668 TaxID=2996035 RepID=UPI000532469E|nr:helix-turn-helix domain-containing protein [Sphingobacterium sp. SYP-B4668]